MRRQIPRPQPVVRLSPRRILPRLRSEPTPRRVIRVASARIRVVLLANLPVHPVHVELVPLRERRTNDSEPGIAPGVGGVVEGTIDRHEVVLAEVRGVPRAHARGVVVPVVVRVDGLVQEPGAASGVGRIARALRDGGPAEAVELGARGPVAPFPPRARDDDVVVVCDGDVEKRDVGRHVGGAGDGLGRGGEGSERSGRDDELGIEADKAAGHVKDHLWEGVEEGAADRVESGGVEGAGAVVGGALDG